MPKKLYVGNLPFSATDDEVRQHFEQHGEVHAVHLIADRETGRPRGFGFVEMEDEAAERAMAAFDGTDFGGRSLRVSYARRQESGPPPRGGGSSASW